MISYHPIIQTIQLHDFIKVDVLRLDQLHSEISGNKWFKLKNNLTFAKQQGLDTILTFGGAHSNHIAACAAACQLFGFKGIGIIRGEDNAKQTDTIKKAVENGMRLYFVSRDQYKNKEEEKFLQSLIEKFGKHYLIPEGGNNEVGIKGCAEILNPEWDYDFILCACGTATTYLGLLASAQPHQKIVGINVLKGKNEMLIQVQKTLNTLFPSIKAKPGGNDELEQPEIKNSFITDKFSFGGYAAFSKTLLDFKNNFEKQHPVPLDYIYTVKLFYAVAHMAKEQKFPINSKLLVIHSGGLQGNKAFETRYHLTPRL